MDDLAAARWVRERISVPLALDESVRGPREALACAAAGACDIFVVKLMKTGGLLNALKVNAIAVADIQRAARQYLRADTAWRAVVTSDNPVAPAAAPAAQ